MNLALLSRLKSRQGRWIDPQSLARSLDLSPHRLERELHGLSGVGYRIETSPAEGVRLVGLPEGLVAEEIAWDLGTELVGRQVIVRPEATSTNDLAWQQIRASGWSAGAAEEMDGLVIFAERQTAGRGRLGRSWDSPPGGLWMSVIVRSPLAVNHRPLLTIAAALAAAHTIHDVARLQAQIRWPNDVTIESRKVAGVLVEAQSAFPDVYVQGIGVNVNLSPDDLPTDVRTTATSLRCELERDVSRTDFARGLLRQLDRWNERVRRGDHASLNDAWRGLASTLGQRTAIYADGKRFEGVVVELDLLGGISLRFDRGAVRTFRSEEVSGVDVLE